MECLGSWIANAGLIQKSFLSASPFPHVVIDNFFTDEFANLLESSFPLISEEWIKYWNPIEKKYALNRFSHHDEFQKLFTFLQSEECVNLISNVTGIDNLETDPHLHGAGLHFHPPGGKLDMHLDYSIHPISKKERRVNLIIYLNKEWREEYNGDIQLWDRDFTTPVKRVYPMFNRAVLFQTNDISYHGMPSMIKCPEHNGRKSIAIYYVSEPTNIGEVRYKAQFHPLPTQLVNDKLRQLYTIRNTITITPTILDSIYPEWEKDGDGWW